MPLKLINRMSFELQPRWCFEGKLRAELRSFISLSSLTPNGSTIELVMNTSMHGWWGELQYYWVNIYYVYYSNIFHISAEFQDQMKLWYLLETKAALIKKKILAINCVSKLRMFQNSVPTRKKYLINATELNLNTVFKHGFESLINASDK